MEGWSIPDSPAALFDAAGRLRACRPLLLIGLTRGADLPCAIRDRLDRTKAPYRIVRVAVPGFVGLFGCREVVEGADAVLAYLERADPEHAAASPPAP